jgi:hypothetical protein
MPASRLNRGFRVLIPALVLAVIASPLPAGAQNRAVVSRAPEAWQAGVRFDRLADIGRGKAIIFSPDIAPSGNREFYQSLGFLYIEEASWQRALNRIIARNYWHPDDPVQTIFLETHGTNGNGLKLQAGPSRTDGRSYISIAALQEKLEGLGVKLCVIAACNSGRLFRPGTYKSIKAQPRDRLFLPATLGIINASPTFDPRLSKIVMVRREESRIETTSEGKVSELSPVARKVSGLESRGSAHPRRFVVSNLLIQMFLHDPRLKLAYGGYANERSKSDLSEAESEALFLRFIEHVNTVAEREYRPR